MTDNATATFQPGDLVAWDHAVATEHAPGSIVRASVVIARSRDALFGVVKGVANEEGTWFDVEFEGGSKVLTEDELVKVLDDRDDPEAFPRRYPDGSPMDSEADVETGKAKIAAAKGESSDG